MICVQIGFKQQNIFFGMYCQLRTNFCTPMIAISTITIRKPRIQNTSLHFAGMKAPTRPTIPANARSPFKAGVPYYFIYAMVPTTKKLGNKVEMLIHVNSLLKLIRLFWGSSTWVWTVFVWTLIAFSDKPYDQDNDNGNSHHSSHGAKGKKEFRRETVLFFECSKT